MHGIIFFFESLYDSTFVFISISFQNTLFIFFN